MKTTVWTKQHKSVLEQLNSSGRYIAKREYIARDLQEHAGLVLEVYDWYVRKAALRYPKPADVCYPVWVSLDRESTMLQSDHAVILELEIDSASIMPVNIGKWGTILNYAYLPADERDARRHRQLLEEYGVDDATAFMTQFYPRIKREIVDSWDRLFDDTVIVNNRMEYGTVWELKKEWVSRVIP